MTSLPVFDYAKTYIGFGFAVFPIHRAIQHEAGFRCSCGDQDCASPAKHPVGNLAPSGLKSATKDQATASAWFANSPLNLGIVTGQTSGIFVLDIDVRHGGDASLVALERQHGPLPKTWRFITGGGGQHILFRHPGGNIPNSASKIGPGIDVRGENGYIVAPPSQHISGNFYSVSPDDHPDDAPLASAPDWLIDAVRQRLDNNGIVAERWQYGATSIVPEGQRNDFIARLAGHLLGRGINPHAALDLLLAYNQTNCVPPLSAIEVTTTVASITRRELTKRSHRRTQPKRTIQQKGVRHG